MAAEMWGNTNHQIRFLLPKTMVFLIFLCSFEKQNKLVHPGSSWIILDHHPACVVCLAWWNGASIAIPPTWTVPGNCQAARKLQTHYIYIYIFITIHIIGMNILWTYTTHAMFGAFWHFSHLAAPRPDGGVAGAAGPVLRCCWEHRRGAFRPKIRGDMGFTTGIWSIDPKIVISPSFIDLRLLHPHLSLIYRQKCHRYVIYHGFDQPHMRTMVLVYKSLRDWVILLGQMLVNIPAPWSIWERYDMIVIADQIS